MFRKNQGEGARGGRQGLAGTAGDFFLERPQILVDAAVLGTNNPSITPYTPYQKRDKS